MNAVPKILQAISDKKLGVTELANLMERDKGQISKELKKMREGGGLSLKTLERYYTTLDITD